MPSKESSTALDQAMADPSAVVAERERLEKAGVEYLFSCWIDLLGQPKTKPVPIAEFGDLFAGKGPQFATHSVSMTPHLGPADPDQIALADLGSVRICPWNERYAWVMADLYWKGEAYDVCPRQALKRQIREAADAGYAFTAGFEPEFIVLRWEDGKAVKAFGGLDENRVGDSAVKRQAFGYDVEHTLDGMDFLDEVVRAINKLGWGLRNVVAEGAYSQFELDFGPSDALDAADRLVFLRVMLKEIAKRHGLFVTFMPKPSGGDWRSGAHLNHSMTRADDPSMNLFEDAAGGWSPMAFNALAGVLRHGAAITSIACPTVNSYKGLVGRAADLEGGTLTWAPTHICYGFNNRSAMVRLPQTRKAIENRACDMCVNPHLALALTIGASLEGVGEELAAGDPIDVSLYDLSDDQMAERSIEQLPRNLYEAATALKNDALARKVLGETMHSLSVRAKLNEWNRFSEHVTEWEQAEYLQFF